MNKFIRFLSAGFIFCLCMVNNAFAGGQEISIKPKESIFVVYGDNRNIGITKNKVHRDLLRQIKKRKKDFIVHLGDMVLWGWAWDSFFKDIASADIKVPFFTVRGNHDNLNQFRNKFKRKKPYYSIDYGMTHLIVLDDNRGFLKNEQLNWLIGDFKEHQGYKWIIVLAHKPLYSGAHWGVRKKLISQLEPLFKKYRVNMFIASHYHSYERLSADGITYIVSGGGGAPLAELREHIPQLIKHKTRYHYLLIHPEDEGIAVKAYGIKGDVIDKFVVR